MKRILAAILSLLLIVSLSACDGLVGVEITEEHPLVGTWRAILNSASRVDIITFNADGTGTHDVLDNQTPFTWHLTSHTSIVISSEVSRLDGRYNLYLNREDSDRVSLAIGRTGAAGRWSLDRVSHPDDVVGVWASVDNPDLVFTFNSDGTGNRDAPSGIVELYWHFGASRLELVSEVGFFQYQYFIIDDVLTVINWDTRDALNFRLAE